MLIFCMFVEASRFDRSLVWHLLFRFEVLVFMFSTYSFAFWSILRPQFGKFSMTSSICNTINYICFYTLALLMDGAPMYPLWLKRLAITFVVLNMIVQLVYRLTESSLEFRGELCINSSLCVSPAEIAFYRCVWS
jgi:hypothetical protein